MDTYRMHLALVRVIFYCILLDRVVGESGALVVDQTGLITALITMANI